MARLEITLEIGGADEFWRWTARSSDSAFGGRGHVRGGGQTVSYDRAVRAALAACAKHSDEYRRQYSDTAKRFKDEVDTIKTLLKRKRNRAVKSPAAKPKASTVKPNASTTKPKPRPIKEAVR